MGILRSHCGGADQKGREKASRRFKSALPSARRDCSSHAIKYISSSLRLHWNQIYSIQRRHSTATGQPIGAGADEGPISERRPANNSGKQTHSQYS